MPWWLGLPVLLVWAVFVLFAYFVIGLLWAAWLIGHGAKRAFHALTERSEQRAVHGSPPTVSPTTAKIIGTRLVDSSAMIDARNLDPLFAQVARSIASKQVASLTMLQQEFNIGYARAGRLIDQLASCGVVGPFTGAGNRNVLMTADQVRELIAWLNRA